METTVKPLDGLKVLDITHVMAGPTAGLMLADMGADVIKVERLPGGDDSRRFGPPRLGDQSVAFMMVNRNKRGIAVDFRSPDGQAVLRRLAGESDVLIENFRKGVMEKMGLGYEALAKANPGLIYCAISGYGRTGPWAHKGGFDLIAQGITGLMSITGEGADRPPVKVGAPLTDITAGILAAMGIAAAYAARLRTGKGQMVDTSLFEAGMTQTYWQSAMALATGVAPGPMGSAHPMAAPYQAFEAADGWLTIGTANQAIWAKLVDVMGAGALARDPRFADNHARVENAEALAHELGSIFKGKNRAEWLSAFEAAGVPAGPVLNMVETLAHEQAAARNMVHGVDHAELGEVDTLGHPVKFGGGSGEPSRQGAPTLGQHSREVLSEVGYTEAEINGLVESGVVGEG